MSFRTSAIMLLPTLCCPSATSVDRKEALALECLMTPQPTPPTPAALCKLSGVCLLLLRLWVGQHGAAIQGH